MKSRTPKTTAVAGKRKSASLKGRPRACTWDEVLEAAERVMEREGYTSLSMRALADELGIAHPSLYTYFTHIEEVEVAVLKSVASRVPAPVSSTAAQLRAELLNYVQVAHDYALNHQRLLESPVGSPAWVALTERSLQWMKALTVHTGDERRAMIAYSALISVAKNTADLERINGDNAKELTNSAVKKHFGITLPASKEGHLMTVATAIIDSMLPELQRKKK